MRRLRVEQEREELLNRRFTRNTDMNDTTILIDSSIQHQNSLQVPLIIVEYKNDELIILFTLGS